MKNFNQWMQDYKTYLIDTIIKSKEVYKAFYKLSSEERRKHVFKDYMTQNGTSVSAYDLYLKANAKAKHGAFLTREETTIEHEIEKIAQKEMEAYKQKIEAKVKKHVGNIIEWELGNMEYIVHGDEGRAKVEAIYAGGYNIQRLHVRVIVKKLK